MENFFLNMTQHKQPLQASKLFKIMTPSHRENGSLKSFPAYGILFIQLIGY